MAAILWQFSDFPVLPQYEKRKLFFKRSAQNVTHMSTPYVYNNLWSFINLWPWGEVAILNFQKTKLVLATIENSSYKFLFPNLSGIFGSYCGKKIQQLSFIQTELYLSVSEANGSYILMKFQLNSWHKCLHEAQHDIEMCPFMVALKTKVKLKIKVKNVILIIGKLCWIVTVSEFWSIFLCSLDFFVAGDILFLTLWTGFLSSYILITLISDKSTLFLFYFYVSGQI